jgi:hypothetical protein
MEGNALGGRATYLLEPRQHGGGLRLRGAGLRGAAELGERVAVDHGRRFESCRELVSQDAYPITALRSLIVDDLD